MPNLVSKLLSIGTILVSSSSVAFGWDKACVDCEQFSYHIFIKGPSSWAAALHATPDGCVLAPVTCEEDWIGINSALSDNNQNYAYIGIYKPMDVYLQECPLDDNLPCDVLTTGWLNLDGSEVPDYPNLWDDGHPINSRGGGRIYGGYNGGGGMRSFRAAHDPDFMDGAVYKCCIPKVGDYCIDWEGTGYLGPQYY